MLEAPALHQRCNSCFLVTQQMKCFMPWPPCFLACFVSQIRWFCVQIRLDDFFEVRPTMYHIITIFPHCKDGYLSILKLNYFLYMRRSIVVNIVSYRAALSSSISVIKFRPVFWLSFEKLQIIRDHVREILLVLRERP